MLDSASVNSISSMPCSEPPFSIWAQQTGAVLVYGTTIAIALLAHKILEVFTMPPLTKGYGGSGLLCRYSQWVLPGPVGGLVATHLAGVPVQEGLAAEHGRELLADALEHLLDGGGVAQEGGAHLQALGRDVAHLSHPPISERQRPAAAGQAHQRRGE
jgi:hypothetical protein